MTDHDKKTAQRIEKAKKRLDEAAKGFTDMLSRLGGGTVEMNGVVIAEVKDATNLTPPSQ